MLTLNAEVLVSGSEATEDYTIQIYTPPYLMGTFVRCASWQRLMSTVFQAVKRPAYAQCICRHEACVTGQCWEHQAFDHLAMVRL